MIHDCSIIMIKESHFREFPQMYSIYQLTPLFIPLPHPAYLVADLTSLPHQRPTSPALFLPPLLLPFACGEGRRRMEGFYWLLFGGLAAVVAALELSKTARDRAVTSTAFNSFKNNYLLVYSLMMGKPSRSSSRSVRSLSVGQICSV